ncbi:glucosamine 6-phosphate n-acetyltransferase [Anaeramoeba flamelloides]|uniref:Glucosamine 6-phosphate n-acetyltransferase n=1 Tax=Anaeramoeba flamelloides TaxID=1746091 RepID=A0AAV8A6W5_9EUKA|nr:glucosamine 6-phosphate n-acetyltransferase [Anaeramoeba flamelloides]
MDLKLKWIDEEDELFQQVLELRWKILREPLGMKRGTEHNDLDNKPYTFHIVAIVGEKVVGTCSLFYQEGSEDIKLFQMGVYDEWQGKGVGKKIVLQILDALKNEQRIKTTNKLLEKRLSKLKCHARAYASAFYEKLGFRKVGEMFVEVSIEHYNMEIELN